MEKLQQAAEGIIVGTTQNQEWLLPWWWMNYTLHNDYPVTFINFGNMSEEGLRWCQARGTVELLDISDDFISGKEDVDERAIPLWEKMHSEVWTQRKGWFKKPHAFLKTPYAKTIWLDLDCQIRGSIKPLFELSLHEAGIAIARENKFWQELNLSYNILLPDEQMYNSGVVVFEKNSPIIQEWAKQSLDQNHLHYGDQQLLVRILHTQDLPFTPLSGIYNWPVEMGLNSKAIILHFTGRCKKIVRRQIEYMQKNLLINLGLVDHFG